MVRDLALASRFKTGPFLALLLLSCSPESPPEPKQEGAGLRVFDKIVTQSLLNAGLRNKGELRFRVSEDSAGRVYEGVYVFPAIRADQHWACVITVAPAGSLIDAKQYADLRAGLEAKNDEESRRRLAADFPDIGRRALREITGFGPGGGSYSLAFTTTDGRFDVKISISNLLPEGVPDPGLDVTATAKRILERYEVLRKTTGR